MQESNPKIRPIKRFGKREILFFTWVVLGLLSLYPVMELLKGSFPIFTVLWLAVPLFVVLRTKDATRIGFSSISWRNLWVYSTTYLIALFVLMLSFEPWSHTYYILVTKAIAASSPDPTFAWIIRYPGVKGWFGMFIFSGLVTIFAEELFFRGWLLQWLQRRMTSIWAVIAQAVLFSLPQALAAMLLPPLQGVLYTVVYSWLAIGVVGGWVAVRTQSIWPSLIGACTCNLILTAFVLLGNP